MSASRKATAAAYLAVMLKVLVMMVVAYALDGQRSPVSNATLFSLSDAFESDSPASESFGAHSNTGPGESPRHNSAEQLRSTRASLKPEIADALVAVIAAHDLNLDVTVFGQDMFEALARAATVAQLLQKSGIPSSALRVIGAWDTSAAQAGKPSVNSIKAVRRQV